MGQKESANLEVETILWNVNLPFPSVVRELPFLLTKGICVQCKENLLTITLDRDQKIPTGSLILEMLNAQDKLFIQDHLTDFFPVALSQLIFDYALKWRCSFTNLTRTELLTLHSHLMLYKENPIEVREALQSFSAMRIFLRHLNVRRIEIGKSLELRKSSHGYEVRLYLSEESLDASFFLLNGGDYRFDNGAGSCCRAMRRNEFVAVSRMIRKFLEQGIKLFQTAI